MPLCEALLHSPFLADLEFQTSAQDAAAVRIQCELHTQSEDKRLLGIGRMDVHSSD